MSDESMSDESPTESNWRGTMPILDRASQYAPDDIRPILQVWFEKRIGCRKPTECSPVPNAIVYYSRTSADPVEYREVLAENILRAIPAGRVPVAVFVINDHTSDDGVPLTLLSVVTTTEEHVQGD